MKPSGGARLASIGLALAALFAVIAAMEVAVRIADPQPAFRYRFSPATWYEPIPGARFTYQREEFAVPVEYNSFGMRDRERSIENGSGALRVALVGDSFAEAKEVPFDSTLAQTLERLMAANLREQPVEVLNFGVSGFGTVASTIRFESLGAKFHPDVVIYLFVQNDPADNVENDARLYTLRDGALEFHEHRLSDTARIWRASVDWAKQNLHVYRFLRFRAERLVAARNTRNPARGTGDLDAKSAGGDSGAPAWRITRLAIARLRDRVADTGGRLLVVQGTTSGAEMTKNLALICSELGIPFLDIVPALAADPGPVRYQFDGHWRSRGHAVAARAIALALVTILAEPEQPTLPPARVDTPRPDSSDALH
ncbi:MAG: hypothetical protein ACKVU1_14880 [bacterium]